MDKIRPEIRTFVLGTIGLSTATWNVAFNLGAYRTVFYRNIFAVWVMVTTILLVILLLRGRDVGVPWWGTLLMLVPTLGLALLPVNATIGESGFTWFTTGLYLFAILVCLPYAIYVVVNVVNADLLNLPEARLRVSLVIIVLVIGLIGFWAGANNHLFLKCGDFKIAGDDLPANCQPGPPMQL